MMTQLACTDWDDDNLHANMGVKFCGMRVWIHNNDVVDLSVVVVSVHVR